MGLENLFRDNPSNEKLNKILDLGLLLTLIIYPFMTYLFNLAGDSIAQEISNIIIQGQLSFNGLVMKDYYSRITDLGFYRIGQIMDYGFMLAYGLLLFSLCLRSARKFPVNTMGEKIGKIIGLLAIISPILDAIENVFILLMLSNPFDFPDWLAIVHSSFAVPKWIFLGIELVWIFLSPLLRKIVKK
jgi:hypothetical protein